jgi:hypothetical protein
MILRIRPLRNHASHLRKLLHLLDRFDEPQSKCGCPIPIVACDKTHDLMQIHPEQRATKSVGKISPALVPVANKRQPIGQ